MALRILHNTSPVAVPTQMPWDTQRCLFFVRRENRFPFEICSVDHNILVHSVYLFLSYNTLQPIQANKLDVPSGSNVNGVDLSAQQQRSISSVDSTVIGRFRSLHIVFYRFSYERLWKSVMRSTASKWQDHNFR